MKVLIIGANGATGRLITRRLSDSTHDPLAMTRNPSQRSWFDDLGVPAVLGDLEYPIDHAVAGCDAVLFAAGSGGKTGKDKTVLVDQLGAIRAAVTAAMHGAKRFVLLSSLNADLESESGIRHYHRAKAAADHFLRAFDRVMDKPLDWTTVHPGGLTNDDSTGRATITEKLKGDAKSKRADVAEVMVQCLDRDNTIGRSIAVLDGDTPIDQALDQL